MNCCVCVWSYSCVDGICWFAPKRCALVCACSHTQQIPNKKKQQQQQNWLSVKLATSHSHVHTPNICYFCYFHYTEWPFQWIFCSFFDLLFCFSFSRLVLVYNLYICVCVENMMLTAVGFLFFNLPCNHSLTLSHLRLLHHSTALFLSLSLSHSGQFFSCWSLFNIFGCFFPCHNS